MITRLIISIILLLNLSGCAGIWFSRNATGKEIAIKHEEGRQPFIFLPGTSEKERQDHPDNGTKIFSSELRLCGITIWAVLPIPLLLPICRSYTEVTYADGKPTKRVDHYVKGSGLLCGPFVLIATAFNGGTPTICSISFHD